MTQSAMKQFDLSGGVVAITGAGGALGGTMAQALSEIGGAQDTVPDDEKEKIKEKLKSLGYI